ncbi:hypothetical protein ABPG74_003734 [Tetrahymena malaccensis]
MSYNNLTISVSAKQQVEALAKKNFEINDKNYENSQKIRNQNTPNVRNLRNQMANIIIDQSNNHSPIKTNGSYNNQNSAVAFRISTPSPIKFLQEDYQGQEDKSGQSKSQIFYQDYANNSNNDNNNINYIKQQSKRNMYQQANNQVQRSQIFKTQEEQNSQQPSSNFQHRIGVQNGVYQIAQPLAPFDYQNERNYQPGNNFNNDISPKFANISVQPAQQNQQSIQRLATMSGQQQQVKQYYQQQQLTPQKSLNQLNTQQMQTNQTAPPKYAQFSPIFSQKQIVNYPINMQPIFPQKGNALNQQNNQNQVPPPINISEQLRDQMIYPNLANQTPQAQIFQSYIIPQQLPLDSVRKSLRSISANQDALQNQFIQINQNPSYQKVQQIQNLQENYQKPVILISQPQQQYNNQIYQQPLQNRQQIITVEQPHNQQNKIIYQDQQNRPQISNRSISIDPNSTQHNQPLYIVPNINQKSSSQTQSSNIMQQQMQQQQPQQQQQIQQNNIQEATSRIQPNNLNNSARNKNGKHEIKIQINGNTDYLQNICNEQRINSQKKQPLQNSNIQQGNIITNNFRLQTEITPEKKKNESQYFRASLSKSNLQSSMQKQQLDENEIQNISEKKLAQMKDFSKSPSRFFAHVKEQLNKVKKQTKNIQTPITSFNDQSLRKIEVQSSSIKKQALQQTNQQPELNNSQIEDYKQISQSDLIKDNSYSKSITELKGQQSKQKPQLLSSFSQLERSKQQIQVIKERIAAISKNSTDESPFHPINNEEQEEINENKDLTEYQKESSFQKIQRNQIQLLFNAAEYSLELDTDYSPIVDGKKVHLNIFKNTSKIQDSTESLQAQLK